MYKVFIENRPVIFSTEVEDGSASVNLKSLNFESDILPLVKSFEEGQELTIRLDKQQQFEELFRHHEKVTAAGGIVRRKDKLLFIKRNGVWDIPKGKVELHESIQEAAIREVEEECGLKNVQLIDFLIKTYHTYQFKGKWVLKATHWFSMSYDGPKDTKPQVEEGITKVKWYKIGCENDVLENTYPSIKEVLQCYFETLVSDKM